MSHPPLRLAVMGSGLIGRRHAEHIHAAPDCDLLGLIDPSPEAGVFAAQLGVPCHADLSSQIAIAKPDGLIIATPNALHVPHALDAIAAGIPVLVEKPLADTLEGGERLVAAAESAGLPLLTGHHRRHNPTIRAAKSIIEAGRLGQIVAVHGFFWLMKPDDYFDVPWRRERGAGPVLLNLSHDVDLMRHLCGEITEVQALQSSAVRNFAVDETTVVIFRFANGALGTFNVSDTVVAPWSWEQTTGENPAYPQTDQSCYHIGGTHGALSLPRLELWTNAGKRSWWEPFAVERQIAAKADPLRLQIEQFCRVIRHEEPPLVSGHEGLATLRVIEAIRRSAESGERVKIG